MTVLNFKTIWIFYKNGQASGFFSFNAKKCKVMRLGGQHPEFIYKMTNNTDVTDMEFTEMEKYLGIHVDNKL